MGISRCVSQHSIHGKRLHSCRWPHCCVPSLHTSSSHHLDQVVRALLENDAKADATEEDGFTALMFSAQNGHDLCALALIEANANLDHQNPKKVTALNFACENAHEECAVLLLKAGSRSADIADAWGDTPRSIAEKKGLKKVLALM